MPTPSTDLDLFSDESLLEPYENYRALRQLGPAVRVNKLGMYAVPRYRDVKEILTRPDVFISGRGVMLNDISNNAYAGQVGICMDGEQHRASRSIEGRPLTPKALREVSSAISHEAELIVEELCKIEDFDAATTLAQHLPLNIVSNLVGLPEAGRSRMLDWASANFNSFGPLNKRAEDAMPLCKEMQDYALSECIPSKLKPGSWAAMLHNAADRGEITDLQARMLSLSYVGPSLDTTIYAISNAIWLFARHPDQWRILQEAPRLIPNAINEILRIESPAQAISRYVTEDFDLDGTIIPSGSRIVLLYGSANRDEQKWGNPEEFDITRQDARDHLGFGYGVHQCLGNNLARMEIAAILTSLLKRVNQFTVHDAELALNNTLRGFQKLTVTVS